MTIEVKICNDYVNKDILFVPQDLSNSESGSETGLNCPASSPGEDDGNLRPQNQATQTQRDQLIVEAETDSVDLSQVKACTDYNDSADYCSAVHCSKNRKSSN